jgi:heme-degrading monooxygenase HmoA
MYISVSEADVSPDLQEKAKAEVERVHEFMRTMPGFRWAMLLHSLEAPDRFASVSMWLTPDQASSQDGAVLGERRETAGYDVVTARGAMTPATHLAVVEWQVGDQVASRFANRWNAVYHAIEDRIGSRLLRDLQAPGRTAGLHAVTEEGNLDPKTLGAPLEADEGLVIGPASVQRYEVLLLAEA